MNVSKAVFKEAVIVQMTWPGAPTVYYGDEAGLCGWTDPDNRRTYPWGKEDHDLIEFHKAAIRIHKSVPALVDGSYKSLHGDYNVIAYGRFKADSKAIVIVNNNDTARQIEINVWECGITDAYVMKQLILSSNDSFQVDVAEYKVSSGKMKIEMPPLSATILVAT